MHRNRFWIEIIAVGTIIACLLAVLIATLGAGAAAVAGQEVSAATPGQASSGQSLPKGSDGPSQTYEGMVTCTRCGAKHPAKLNRAASNCALMCVHSGADFALIDGEKVYQLQGNLTAVKKFAGQRAQITGVVHGNTIDVSAVVSIATS